MYNKYKKNPQKLQKIAEKIIPGVSQLFGKRPDLYLPGGKWPTYYSKAKGVTVWGIDNKKYYDFTMVGVGTSTLGYSDPDINKAAFKAIKSSTMNTLNPPEDVELAELLLKLHPWAESVRYCRTGGETMAVAVRLARAYTKKNKILFCGYHGWHDWYLSANIRSRDSLNEHLLTGLDPVGVPKVLKNSAIPFRFNNFQDLEKIVKTNARKCAAIILEPCRDKMPDIKFLKKLRSIATKNKCVLIFDEITSGWRTRAGGVHMDFRVYPDIAVFGKTIANGIAMGAIIGTKKIMKYSTKTFLSSAFWTERLGPACSLAFIKKHQKLKLGKILINKGKQIKKVWFRAAQNSGLDISINGIDPLPTFKLNIKDWPSSLTFFIQEMLKRGFLASDKCYANLKHSLQLIKLYEKNVHEVFMLIKELDKKNLIKKNLEGPVKTMGFKRLT
jgi:glutamate-1-semialdehyde 2,1-aminomutase